MKIELSRIQIMLLGFCLTISVMLIQRLYIISQGAFAHGEVIRIHHWHEKGASRYRTYHTAALVQFSTRSGEIVFQALTDMDLNTGQTVKVLYIKDAPNNASVFSFVGFWSMPLLYCAFSFLIIAAPCLAFLESQDKIELQFKPLKFRRINKNKITHLDLP